MNVCTSADHGTGTRIMSLKSKVEHLIVHCIQITNIKRGISVKFMEHDDVWAQFNRNTRIMHLNMALDHVPLRVLKSVIIHELCHEHYTDHGDAFWSLVRSVDHNAADADEYLARTSPRKIINE